MTLPSSARVIVCQIGAREHYAFPRTLHQAGLLAELITDAWVSPESMFRRLPGRRGARLGGRYDATLEEAQVTHFTSGFLRREAIKIVSPRRGNWRDIISHNLWFQAQTVRHFRTNRSLEGHGAKPIVLAYSYAAREILIAAREAGAFSILGQIDGGEADEALISTIWAKRGGNGRLPANAPEAYWNAWHDECRLADRILVNSSWSRELLIRAGVDKAKLVVLPVVYEPSMPSGKERRYPATFDGARSLKILFLGNLTMRKGVLEALQGARELRNLPVHFNFVGADSEGHGALLRREPNISVLGFVPRCEVPQKYFDADVFLFPTHSDGFGMTQIEALEAGLPVIASRNCALLVEHARTGLILDELSGHGIASAIRVFLNSPEKLKSMSVAAMAASQAFARRNSAACIETIQRLASEGIQ